MSFNEQPSISKKSVMSSIAEDNDCEVSSKNTSEPLEEDTLKILLATDCHLGYEKTTKRRLCDDSFIVFEEILQYAVKYKVDLILLGGDLFHDSKPSQATVLRCLNLLRKYCLGDREVKVQFLTDPQVVFSHCYQKTVNFEDPNFNISIPVFSIHGNHDDPCSGGIGSMDLLCATGLVNYFGKWTDLSNVEIPPLLFKKGQTNLALYGLSFMNDQRLSRLIRDEKFNFIEVNDEENFGDSFNMFVLHQNRVKHSEYGYIPENKLPKSLHLIIWGHEHECRIDPEYNEEGEYCICQPGSSVATSLCPGEAVPKHVGLLYIHKQTFKLKKLKLNTVRPFVFKEIRIKDEEISDVGNIKQNVFQFVDHYIENIMIPEAARQITGHKLQPLMPLIRLRLIYETEYEVFDSIKLAQRFCEEVANPTDIIMWKKERITRKKEKRSLFEDDEDDEIWGGISAEKDQEMHLTVQERLTQFFKTEKNKGILTVLSIKGLNQALTQFTDKDDSTAFTDIIRHQIKKNLEYVDQYKVSNDNMIMEKVLEFQNIRLENEEDEDREIHDVFNDKSREISRTETAFNDDINSEDENELGAASTRKRGRGATRSRARGKRGASTARSKASKHDSDEDLDIQEVDFDGNDVGSRSKTTRGRGRGRAQAGTTIKGIRGRGRASSKTSGAVCATSYDTSKNSMDDFSFDSD